MERCSPETIPEDDSSVVPPPFEESTTSSRPARESRTERALSEPVVGTPRSSSPVDRSTLASSTRSPSVSILTNDDPRAIPATPNYARGKLAKLRDRRADKAAKQQQQGDLPRALSFRTFERDIRQKGDGLSKGGTSAPPASPARGHKRQRSLGGGGDKRTTAAAGPDSSSDSDARGSKLEPHGGESSPSQRGSFLRQFSREGAGNAMHRPSWVTNAVSNAVPVVASLVAPIQQALETPPDEEVKVLSVSLTLNKQLRHKLFTQSYFSNRFVGSPVALRVEAEYHAFVTQYQLHKVRKRLVFFALCLLPVTVPEAVGEGHTFSHILLRTILPVAMLLLAFSLCCWSRSRRWWRQVVMSTAVLTYNSILWADALDDLEAWSTCHKDYNTIWQIVWLLFVFNATALFFGLDMIQVAIVLLSVWVSYVCGTITIYAMWYEARVKKEWTWSAYWSDDVGAAGGGDGDDNATGGDDEADEGRSHILTECLVLSCFGLFIMLVAVRRLNRFERQSFVNSFVLTNRVEQQVAQIERKQVQLLALFSNPRVPMHAPVQLRPLQLGQELKFLLRSVENQHVVVEPAASLQDVERAVEAHDPCIVHFSGHSWMGSLAFEAADGRGIEVPPPPLFIHNLRPSKAPRLQCVFLNGCETANLGYQIVSQLPHVMVVCWATITEDAAARAFAQGFYDAVGTYLSDNEPVQVEIAFWSGLERYFAAGFRIGDPRAYLHGPGHPHIFSPDFQGCEGCCPPVHGNVVCLANIDGEVKALREEERPAVLHESSSGAGTSSDLSCGTWVKVVLSDLAPASAVPTPSAPSPPAKQGILSSLRSTGTSRPRPRTRERTDAELSSASVCTAQTNERISTRSCCICKSCNLCSGGRKGAGSVSSTSSTPRQPSDAPSAGPACGSCCVSPAAGQAAVASPHGVVVTASRASRESSGDGVKTTVALVSPRV